MQDTYAGPLFWFPNNLISLIRWCRSLRSFLTLLLVPLKVLVGRLLWTKRCLLIRRIILEIWWILHQVIVLLAVVGCLTSKTQLLHQFTRLVSLIKAVVKSKVLITKKLSDDTNNTQDKLAGCFIALLIFFLTLCCFFKNVNLIAEKMKNILKNRYLWLVLGKVRKIIDRGCCIPLFFKYYPKWRNNEANFLDKMSCLYGAGQILFTLVAIIFYCCQPCARCHDYPIHSINHRDPIAAGNNRARDAGA